MPRVGGRMPKMRSRLLLIATVSAALLPAAGAHASTCAGVDLVPDATNVAQVADATLCLINEQRTAAGRGPVTADATLSSASTAYAVDMVARDFFAHESPDGGTLDQRLARVGYSYEIAGENIAWGEGVLATPAQIVNAWMNSEGHRTNIMDGDFRQIGLGIVPDVPHASSFGGATYVTDFGTPSGQPAPRSAPQSATLAARAGSPRATPRGPIAHYSVKKQHARRAAAKRAARRAAARRAAKRHVRRHVRRNVRTHWQTVS